MITEQQRADRRLGIGGSDISAMLGLSKYKTPFELYQEKLGLIEPNKKESNAARVGKIMESLVIELYEEHREHQLIAKGEVPTKCHPIHSFMRANVDGILASGALVEAKTTSYMNRKLWGEAETGQIPRDHACQVAFYSLVYDPPYVDVPVIFRGTEEFQVYLYTRNAALESMIQQQCLQFWNNVQTETPPMAQTFGDLVNMYTKTVEESYAQLDETIYSDWEKFISLQTQIKQLEGECEQYKLKLARFMEDREYLLDKYQNKVVSFKFNKDGTRLDTAELKRCEPVVYSKYQKESKPSRVFRVLGKKECP